MSGDQVRVTVDVPAADHRLAKERLAREGKTFQQLLSEFLVWWARKEERRG